MITPKQVLVVTTNSIEGHKIKRYLKPVSSHVVAGTNVFSDMAASFSDFFGGRSESYQKQLSSLYNEAIERVKVTAHDLGANCVVGLKVDMDEISGKGKSMFMITVVGTAVVIENLDQSYTNTEKVDKVSFEQLDILRRKSTVINNLSTENWNPSEELLDFVTENQIEEAFPALINRYKNITTVEGTLKSEFYKRILIYLNNFSDEKKRDMIYLTLLKASDEKLIKDIYKLISELYLLDLKFVYQVIENDEFENKKKALQLLRGHKPTYTQEDISDLQKISSLIPKHFPEKGTRGFKKQLMSSKEKEVWTCTCGETNDVFPDENSYCKKCGKDIHGFKNGEIILTVANEIIDQRIKLISHFIN